MLYKIVVPAAFVSVALVVTGVGVVAAQGEAININVPAPPAELAGAQRQVASDPLLLATPASDNSPITLAFQAKINWDLDNVSELHLPDSSCVTHHSNNESAEPHHNDNKWCPGQLGESRVRLSSPCQVSPRSKLTCHQGLLVRPRWTDHGHGSSRHRQRICYSWTQRNPISGPW